MFSRTSGGVRMRDCFTHTLLLRRLALAGWGVCVSLLIASAVVAVVIKLHSNQEDTWHPALLPSAYLKDYVVIPWQERYERLWFLLTCTIGPICGWAVIRFLRPSPWACLGAIAAAIPLLRWLCDGIFAGHFDGKRFLLAAVALHLPLWLRSRYSNQETRAVPYHTQRSGNTTRMWALSALLSALFGLALVGIIGPYDIPTVASECNTELHVASYLIGPSLYYRAPGVVPGLDFESHYGIGHAYAFSYLVGSGGLQKTLERYVVFLLVISLLYFISALLVLTDWLQSAWVALGIAAMLVFMSCQGLSYNGPSCWPIRHPFVFLFLYAAVRGVESAGFWWCVTAAVIAGLSIFWQTDVGLYTLASGVVLYGSGWLFLRTPITRGVVFLAVGVATFFAINTTLFGPRVLSLIFVERLFEPLLLYATGFGNQLLNWDPGWGYWYNLIGPGLAIASVSVMLSLGNVREYGGYRPVLYAGTASLLGLALLFKWVNRSIDILWDLNGGLIIAVVGWWMWIAWHELASLVASTANPRAARLRQFGLIAAVGLLTCLAITLDYRLANPNYQGGSSSPLVRTCLWFQNFRNPINAFYKNLEPDVRNSPIDPEVSEYLHRNTRRTERVAVICGADWNYLVDAGRAPRLYWLQLFLIHSPTLLDRCIKDLENSERVFVDRYAWNDLKGVNPEVYRQVKFVIDNRFELIDNASKRWDLYRRKTGETPGQ
jgi:hypothetical protein